MAALKHNLLPPGIPRDSDRTGRGPGEGRGCAPQVHVQPDGSRVNAQSEDPPASSVGSNRLQFSKANQRKIISDLAFCVIFLRHFNVQFQVPVLNVKLCGLQTAMRRENERSLCYAPTSTMHFFLSFHK